MDHFSFQCKHAFPAFMGLHLKFRHWKNKNHQAMRFHHFWGLWIHGRRCSVVAVGSFRSRSLALSSVRGFFQRCGWTGSPCPGAVARHGGGQKRPGALGLGSEKASQAGNTMRSDSNFQKRLKACKKMRKSHIFFCKGMDASSLMTFELSEGH